MIFSPNVLYSPLKEKVLSFLGKRPQNPPYLAQNLYNSEMKMENFLSQAESDVPIFSVS